MKKGLALLFLVVFMTPWSSAQEVLDRQLDFHAQEVLLKDALLQLSLQTNVPFSAPSHLLPTQKITIK